MCFLYLNERVFPVTVISFNLGFVHITQGWKWVLM
jgi:hypothetical protein